VHGRLLSAVDPLGLEEPIGGAPAADNPPDDSTGKGMTNKFLSSGAPAAVGLVVGGAVLAAGCVAAPGPCATVTFVGAMGQANNDQEAAQVFAGYVAFEIVGEGVGAVMDRVAPGLAPRAAPETPSGSQPVIPGAPTPPSSSLTPIPGPTPPPQQLTLVPPKVLLTVPEQRLTVTLAPPKLEPVPSAAAEEGTTALSTIRQTTEGEQFFHYGYAEQADLFAGGLRSGGYATPISGLSGTEAQAGLALPHAIPPNAMYTVTPLPGTWIQVNPTAAALFGQPGGLPEVQFLYGTTPGTISLPFALPW
jgi:hypothetical protein